MHALGPISLIGLITLLGVGCVSESVMQTVETTGGSEETRIVFPVENYREGRWFKTFGEYIDDRFTGYHVADDVEPDSLERETPVVSITKGTVARVDFVGGYGGLVVVEHTVDREVITALYGHLDLGSVRFKSGDLVEAGEFIGNLGDDASEETDGERKHLHFGLHEGRSEKINGYEANVSAVRDWINPTDFFIAHGLDATTSGRRVDPNIELGGGILSVSFELPEGWEVEWIPQIEAWNLFTPSGEGSARDRSQMLIRYFDASNFVTLSTVTIHSADDIIIGKTGYTARRYDIEKKPSVADFAYQPSWRNERHLVTDFRYREGRTRYYVVAANPELDARVYEEVLASMEIL